MQLIARRRPTRGDVPSVARLDLRCCWQMCWLALILCCASAVAVAYAQADSEHAGYSELIDEALREFDDGHYTEARALFERAHALWPNARTLRGLGMTSYELRAYDESIRYFEAALRSTERPLNAALKAEVTAQLERARRFVARIELKLVPANTQLVLDEVAVEVPSEGLRIAAGRHSMRFQAEGYHSEERIVDVRGGEQLSWTIELRKVEPLPTLPPVALVENERAMKSEAPVAPVQPVTRHERTRLYKKPWVWIGTAVVLGGVITGVVLALKRDTRVVEGEPIASSNTPGNGVIYTLRGAP